MNRYRVNEVFRSPQGEGAREGDPSVFIRFTGCNLRCAKEPGPRSPGGFDCDTEFMSGFWWHLPELIRLVDNHRISHPGVEWVVLTGGEPMLQVDDALVRELHHHGWKIQIETNGTRKVPDEWDLDWVTVSPKVAEHAIKQRKAHEVKYVRGYGQDVPRTVVEAERKFISPAFEGIEGNEQTVAWCKGLVESNPGWELSIQMHKVRGER